MGVFSKDPRLSLKVLEFFLKPTETWEDLDLLAPVEIRKKFGAKHVCIFFLTITNTQTFFFRYPKLSKGKENFKKQRSTEKE